MATAAAYTHLGLPAPAGVPDGPGGGSGPTGSGTPPPSHITAVTGTQVTLEG